MYNEVTLVYSTILFLKILAHPLTESEWIKNQNYFYKLKNIQVGCLIQLIFIEAFCTIQNSYSLENQILIFFLVSCTICIVILWDFFFNLQSYHHG